MQGKFVATFISRAVLLNMMKSHLLAISYKLIASKCRVDVRKWFFNQRIVNIWNSLPATAECFAMQLVDF
jgi:hypothetical protein